MEIGAGLEGVYRPPKMKPQQKFFDWVQELHLAERLFGLRPVHPNSSLSCIGAGDPAAFNCDGDCVFLAVNVEAYMGHNEDQGKVIEVGFSYLDTRSTSGVPPGKGGKIWKILIRSEYARVKEFRNLRNKYPRGGKKHDVDAFRLYGNTRVIQRHNDLFSFYRNLLKKMSNLNGRNRNVVLVGHNLNNVLRCMKQSGYYVTGVYVVLPI